MNENIKFSFISHGAIRFEKGLYYIYIQDYHFFLPKAFEVASDLALAASSLAFCSAALLAAASSRCFLMMASLARSARASSVLPR